MTGTDLSEVINLERAVEKAVQEFKKPHFPDEQTETQKFKYLA